MTVETLLEAASPGANGDVLLVSGHVYGVFDGGPSGVIAGEVFGERTRAPLVELCDEANRRIGEAKEGRGSAAAVIRLGRDAFEWVAIGHGELVVVRADGSFERLSPAEPHVLDGSPEALGLVRAGQHNLAGVRHILLFTDGLVAPGSDVPALVGRFIDVGLDAVFAPLRELSARDDVAAVAISFLPPNPATMRRRLSKPPRKLTGAKRSSGVPSRRRRSRP